MHRHITVAGWLASITLACTGVESGDVAAPDIVMVGGAVHTMDDARTRASAVAMRGGEIVYVGDDAGARALAGPGSELVDLSGRMLLPGFNDSHVHLATGGLYLVQCDLVLLESADAILARVAECADQPGYGEASWLLGGGWANTAFANGDPGLERLDALVPDRPAYLVSTDGHTAWVNTRALELAGIDRSTPDPPNGRIERHPTSGEPTGALREEAMLLVKRITPEPSLELRIAGIGAAAARAHAFGITAAIEPGLDAFYLDAYRALAQREGLELRVLASLSPLGWQPGAVVPEELFSLLSDREQYRVPPLAVDSVKLYTDGVIESGMGYLVSPYVGANGWGRGAPYYDPADFNALVTQIDAQGLQVHIHSIGDAGVRMALDAFAAARTANGARDTRHHIVHLQLIDAVDRPRFAELGVAANFQGYWAWPNAWALEMDLPILGAERTEAMFPIGSVERAGGHIVGGSDWWVTSMNPLDAIEAAVRRQDPHSEEGPTLNAAERVSLDAMLAAYTRNGAWLAGREDEVGTIEVGKRADIVVLDRDLTRIPATEINEAEVVMTFFDGALVYSALDGPWRD